MPATLWSDIIGYNCQICGGFATHFYGSMAICCDCHVGGDEDTGEPLEGLTSQYMAATEHLPAILSSGQKAVLIHAVGFSKETRRQLVNAWQQLTDGVWSNEKVFVYCVSDSRIAELYKSLVQEKKRD